jgi:transketolase
MRNAFVDRLLDLAREDSRIMLLTGDLGFGVLEKFSETIPEQFINCGVAEQNMTAVASGLALEGKIPFTYSIGNFPTLRCLEQIRNDIAYHDLPVKIVCIGGGFSYGQLGMSHHATEDLSIMRSIPGMSVYAPCSKEQAACLTSYIINKPGPCYFRLDKAEGSKRVELSNCIFEKVDLIEEGSDLTILATGSIIKEAESAYGMLTKDSISCDLLAVHSIKPIDRVRIIESIKKTRRVITVEEHSINGGLGSIIAEICSDECLELTSFKRIGLNDVFSSIVGDQEFLREYYSIDAESIYTAARRLT